MTATGEQATLRDVCLPVVKADPAELGREAIRYIDIGSIDGARHMLSDVAEIQAADAPSRCRQVVQAGDTVFSTVRPYLKKIAYVDGPLDGEFASTGFCVLRPGPRLLPKYLYYFSISPVMLDQVLPYQKGVSYPAVLDKEVRATEIPVPPLDEQLRIVALLEDHLSRLDASDAYVHAGLARAQVWYAKVIDQLVWSPGNPHREVRSLLREPMRNGRSDRAVQGSEGGTRTLTLTAVTRNSFIDEHTKLTTTTRDRAVGLWLEPGDILVQRSNTPELVGTSARFDGPRDWAIFPDLLIRLRADESLVDSRFLSAALRSKRGHVQLRRRAKGAAGSMPKIDQEAVGSVLIPLPSGKDQRRIVAQVAAADTGLRQLRAELEAVQLRSAALRRSLLAAVFSDRLSEASAQTATA